MNSALARPGRLTLLVAALATLLEAQPAPSPAPTAQDLARYDKNKNGRLDPEELAAKSAAEARTGDVVSLTPFEVAADAFDTYDATNTNSITGTNTALGKTPLDAKVFNRQLMDEMGVVDMTEMLSKLGGLGSAIIGGGNEDVRGDLEGDRQDPKSMTMRGLTISNPRRDGFLRSDTTLLDSFDIERVEAIGGSNSLLFGSGDAGGVVTSASKRAYLRRRPTATFAATGDSEGTRRYTIDAQAGWKYAALRVNAVRADTLFFRPGTRQMNEGLQLAGTLQPWKRLQIRGEWRHFSRDTIFAQAVIVRAPLTTLLPTGERMDNQNSRYLVAFPNVGELTGGNFDLTKVDSATGPFTRDAYKAQAASVVAETTVAEGLALQLRYGHDARINDPLRPSTTTVYAPGAAGNNYVDPVTGLVGTQWAMSQSMTATPFWTGARGYRAALAYQKDLKSWGRHQFSAFYQDMESWVNQEPWRFYEADANGTVIQNLANITNAESGRTTMPAVWMRLFPEQVIGGKKWPFTRVLHPNGKTYVYQPQIYSGAVPPTKNNPLGLSGAISATTGESTNTTYYHDDTRETSYGLALFSEWWKGRLDTMVGYRSEEAEAFRVNTGLRRGPITYDSLTTGFVLDTPIKGVRFSANYSTNAKINFDTTRDIYNEPLPPGKGESRDFGLKFGLWDHTISGNINYYVSEQQNFTAGLGGTQNDVDPNGINGRNGGSAFTYSKTSDGFNATLSARPVRGWEIRLNFATANGSERSDVVLPQFYNDQFNTTTVGGQTVVGIRANAGGPITPFLVRADPRDPDSPEIPLSLAMLKDPTSPYYAQLDTESGQILNAFTLGLQTPGIGTGATGLPITDHQLGFVSPSGGTLIVRRAGEKTFGYAERSYSLINRYQFESGRLRGLVLGLSTSLREKHRGYMYTDAADGNKRKMFYFPDRLLNDFFAVYRFVPAPRIRASVQMNVANLLDANQVMYLIRSTNGTLRYAQWLNAPRKISISTSITY
ncbi:MAG: TonB-dependent receptor plug domain-containing protein [Verrucomicrobia bacterium]|nr:TonB-dependent receptor plug domain-containing protein [Verrucomicrobiota bacterium]